MQSEKKMSGSGVKCHIRISWQERTQLVLAGENYTNGWETVRE